jgi:hypothetical protein
MTRRLISAPLATQIKHLLTKVGPHTPCAVVHGLNAIANYLTVGRWFKENNLTVPVRVADRYRLFDLVEGELGETEVLYLEFGVWKGASMRYWSKLLRHAGSHLHGFDSFQGLSEDWDGQAPKGYFSTGGQPPQIDDPRVKFYKGWFEDTLPAYTLPAHERLFINMDADLYSSTKFVLLCLQERITKGTYIYFDEFSDRFHELKAFDEFLRHTGMEFRVIGADLPLSSVIFQRVA